MKMNNNKIKIKLDLMFYKMMINSKMKIIRIKQIRIRENLKNRKSIKFPKKEYQMNQNQIQNHFLFHRNNLIHKYNNNNQKKE